MAWYLALVTRKDLNNELKVVTERGCDVILLRNKNIAITNVPYICKDGSIKLGLIIETFILRGIPAFIMVQHPTTKIMTPAVAQNSHTVYFDGEFPHEIDGEEIKDLIKPGAVQFPYSNGLTTKFLMSTVPECKYYNSHYEKIIQYYEYISDPAFFVMDRDGISMDDLKQKSEQVEFNQETEGVFIYPDDDSSSLHLNSLANKFRKMKIALIGVGGTGSYILDFLARTPVSEIHLFDGDEFNGHNAFRTPGALSLETVNSKINKATLQASRYSFIRYDVIPHPYNVDESNLDEIKGFDFVFISIDGGTDKERIVEFLVEQKIPFIDCGISVRLGEGKMYAMCSLVYFDGNMNKHLEKNIVYDNEDDDYSTNIQIAEINSLIACQAVIRWKQSIDFYHDSKESNVITTVIEEGDFIHDKN